MSSSSHSLPTRTGASSPAGPPQGGSSQTPEEFADAFIQLPDDFMMELGTVNPSDTVLSPPEAAGTATVSQPPGCAFANPFDAGIAVNHPSLSHGAATSNEGTTADLPASAPPLYSSVLRACAPRPSHPVPDHPEVSTAFLTPQEVEVLRGLMARVTTLEREIREMSPAPGGSPTRDNARSARAARRHQPYPEHRRVSHRPDHRAVPHAAEAPHPPSNEMDMDPISVPIDGSSVQSAPAPVQLPTAAAPIGSGSSRPIVAPRSGRRAPVAASEYHLVNPSTGARQFLHVTRAGLPLFPGAVASAFLALQGSAKSPTELLRRIYLLYRGRAHLGVWKDAVAAARKICRKVALSPPLQLLLELDVLPTNQWERITNLWRVSTNPLSSISLGIRLNPNGFAGLDNYDIETADFVAVWTHGNVKAISAICNRETSRTDVRKAFYDTLSTPGLWTIDGDELQSWGVSSALKRIKYVGQLDPALIAAWLRSEVGLTTFDVVARFAPFAQRAFGAVALTNPRESHTSLFPAEEPPIDTDDTLPEFGSHLDWTPAHGPRGPPL